MKECRKVIQFSGNKPEESGDDSAVEIPVPIPNTEVKHCSGKNSRKVNRARCRVKMKEETPSFFLSFFQHESVLENNSFGSPKFLEKQFRGATQ